ncbi:ARM repeat superfamily protein [Hirschfeldia incana]|nr:ARM repeat superfamily protein [Hirschfeldia incana]
MSLSTLTSTVGALELPFSRLSPISTTQIHFLTLLPKTQPRRRRRTPFPILIHSNHPHGLSNPKSSFHRPHSSGEEAGQQSSVTSVDDNEEARRSGESHVALFVRMLGLDNDPMDREQAVEALWKYSLGGKKCVDAIMQFHGCLNLIVTLLKSESSSTCEAAAGLLRSIASVNLYRELVAESGALEEITALLSRPSLATVVKEQSICALWNLTVDEGVRERVADFDILKLLISFLEDDDVNVKEAAGGVLANLALSRNNHKIMVEVGVIPKLAKLLKGENKGSKVIRKEARNVLLELAKDEYYRILVIEEGVVPIPIIGADAYKSFRPDLYSWPSLPDGVKVEQTAKAPSRFGASELLLGLNVDENVDEVDEAKMKAIVGRTNQQFLARIGAIEFEKEIKSEGPEKSQDQQKQQLTLLPCVDGVARLVLILGLADEVAVSRAAESVADACINEEMRVSFMEAGAVKPLVQLLANNNREAVKIPVIRALKKLSLSRTVCKRIEAEGAVPFFINLLKQPEISQSITEQILDVLAHILDPSKEMESKFYEGPVNGSKADTRKEALDGTVISRLVQIAKTASPNLLRKAISVIEFGTVIDPTMDTIISEDITTVLDVALRQNVLDEPENEAEELEKHLLELEEAGLTISAASRLLTKLLDSESFRQTVDITLFTEPLRKILRSNLPLHYKDWVASCLVKLTSLSSSSPSLNNPINVEVTLYKTIPTLVEQMSFSSTPEAKEAAVLELNRIVSEEGVPESTQALASHGGIEPLVKLLEERNERCVEASLSVLYSLSMDSENHTAIVRAGAVPVLRRIVMSQRPQWEKALRLLRDLPV